MLEIDRGYVEPVDDKRLFEAAVKAMLDTLDPYTEFEGEELAKVFLCVFYVLVGWLVVGKLSCYPLPTHPPTPSPPSPPKTKKLDTDIHTHTHNKKTNNRTCARPSPGATAGWAWSSQAPRAVRAAPRRGRGRR